MLDLGNKSTEKDPQQQEMELKYEQMAIDHELSVHSDFENRNMEGEEDDNADNLPIPIKIVLVCTILMLCGIALFTLGLHDLLSDDSNTGRYISLLTLGVILLIPGVYYSYLLISACFTKSKSERKQILNEFPLDYYE